VDQFTRALSCPRQSRPVGVKRHEPHLSDQEVNKLSYEFNEMSFEEARKASENTQHWLVEGKIGNTTTLIYGEPKVGKSFIACALINALLSGGEFLGSAVPQDRDFSVAVLWTDDGAPSEYQERVDSVWAGTGVPNVRFYEVPVMRSIDMWRSLFNQVMLNRHNVVVIDNLSQASNGSVNQDDVAKEFFDGVRLFSRAGIPVIVIGHSSDKANANGFKSELPLGSTYISSAVRWRVFVKRSRAGNLTLRFKGNVAQEHEVTVKHGAGARFELIDVKSAEQLQVAAEASERQRSQQKLDKGLADAQWVVANCQQDPSRNQAATRFAAAHKLSQQAALSRLRRAPLDYLNGGWVLAA
jgi:hypothetical protein